MVSFSIVLLSIMHHFFPNTLPLGLEEDDPFLSVGFLFFPSSFNASSLLGSMSVNQNARTIATNPVFFFLELIAPPRRAMIEGACSNNFVFRLRLYLLLIEQDEKEEALSEGIVAKTFTNTQLTNKKRKARTCMLEDFD